MSIFEEYEAFKIDLFKNTWGTLENSADPDQRATSDQGQHCLPK